jgi:MFS superfamily sulfate permease-like transporter
MRSNIARLRFPPAQWLREYRLVWLHHDVVAGLTLATYAIPVSLAYATLAGLPPTLAFTDICSVDWAMSCSEHRSILLSGLPLPSR